MLNKKVFKQIIGYFCEKIIIKTIKKGFGHTIGIVLTNILFNNIEGYSLTQIKVFKNKCHYYTYYKKVIIKLIANLQLIPLKLKELDIKSHLFICVNIGGNSRNFYSSEIKLLSQLLFLLNTKLLHYNNNNVLLKFICFIEKGIGYQKLKKQQIGNLISIDNNFSPIEKFNYNIRKTKKKNIETLECTVGTNGSIKPFKTLQLSSIKIQTQLAYYLLKNKKNKHIFFLIYNNNNINNKQTKTLKCLKIY